MLRFKLTDNSKVKFKQKHYNTFSLTQGSIKEGGTCPGMTEGSEGCQEKCYDRGLRRLYKNYASSEDYNTSLVLTKNNKEIYTVIKNSITYWLLTSAVTPPYFRIHTGGDFYNQQYAKAWAEVMQEYSDIKFWAYTRSMFAVPILAKVKNLTLYLSCDNVNKDKVFKTYDKYKNLPNIALAWMGNELPSEFPKDRELLVCPEVTNKIANTKIQGACSRCRACIDRPLKTGNMRHIRFPIHR